MCVVESADGRLLTACDTVAQEGMILFTNTEKMLTSRRMTLSLMCENHRMDCDNCVRYNDCEFHGLCSHNGINSDKYETFTEACSRDEGECIVRDSSKCVLCRRCEAVCGLSLFAVLGRGPLTRIGTVLPLKQSGCAGCGQCVAACPTAALQPLDKTRVAWQMLLKKEHPIAAVVTPAAADILGECFHDRTGCVKEGKAPAIFRKMGFDFVYSSDIFQEEYDKSLIREAGERRTLISGECPGILNCIEQHYPDESKLLARSPSPLRMLIDSIRKEKNGVRIVLVGSCTAMKARARENGLDAVLTVPEAAAMIDRACVSRASAVEVWRQCREEKYDCPQSTDAGRNSDIPSKKVFGLGAFSEKIDANTLENGIIKAYACPKGCLNGGGAPRLSSAQLSVVEYSLRG